MKLAAGSDSEDSSLPITVSSPSPSGPRDHGIVQELCKFASTRSLRCLRRGTGSI